LHVGIIHYVLNMASQIGLGFQLERIYGFFRIAPIYILSGMLGNLLSTLMLPFQVTVGASSAIFGMQGVLLAEIIQNWGIMRNPGKELAKWIATSVFHLLMGLLPEIDNYAHVGGLLGGFFTGLIFLPTATLGNIQYTEEYFCYFSDLGY